MTISAVVTETQINASVTQLSNSVALTETEINASVSQTPISANVSSSPVSVSVTAGTSISVAVSQTTISASITSNGGSGGVTNHALLTNLDYASAGHTGFQATLTADVDYLTPATAAATYQPIGSYLTDAPSDGTTYGRNNGAWAAVSSGITNHALLSNLDYASAGHTGFQAALGFTAVPNTRLISTTTPLSGGGDLSADRTIAISQAGAGSDGYLSSTDWNTFNNKQATLTLPLSPANGGTGINNGTNTLTVPATGTAALLATANVFTATQTISNATPSLVLTDTTASAKSLTVLVDGDLAQLRESAAADGSLMVLDLANSRLGVGTTAPGNTLHVKRGNSGGTPYDPAVVTICLETFSAAYIQFLTPNTQTQGFFFGDPQSGAIGQILYYHSSNRMNFVVASGRQFSLGQNVTGVGRFDETDTIGARLHTRERTATTNAVIEVSRIEASVSTASTGSANGFGVGQSFYAETATDGTYQQQGLISTSWIDATNVSRKAKMSLSAYDTAARLGIEIEADGSAAKLGFYGVTTVARQVLATGAGASADDIITALQNLGLVSQS